MQRHKVKLKKGESQVLVHISVLRQLEANKISHIMVTDSDGEWIHSFNEVPEGVETKVWRRDDKKIFLCVLPVPQSSIDRYRQRCWWIRD